MSVDPSSRPPESEIPARTIALTVNRVPYEVVCQDCGLLLDLLRDTLHLKGTHAGCRNGDCGACTVRIDGEIVKSCLVLAPSAAGADITTIEGLGMRDGLSHLQDAFWEHDGFQCGFCLPGQLFAADDLLRHTEGVPDDAQIRHAMQGNLCRCTGYQKTIDAVRGAAQNR